MDIYVKFKNESDKEKVSEEELDALRERAQGMHGNKLLGLIVWIDPDDQDYMCIEYDIKHTPFKRLRRITGYLVGDMNRWNNAKRKEEGDRVKHGIDAE